MAKRVVDETSLSSVADAIRERAGATDALVFPDGFVSAVEEIPDIFSQYILNKLTSYNNPSVTGWKSYALTECTALQRLNVPKLTNTNWMGCYGCTVLTDVYAPSMNTIGTSGFNNCTSLAVLDLPALKTINRQGLASSGITTLILRNSDVCTLADINAFTNTPIASGTGYVYVPRSLVDTYKSATNWSTYADQIRAIEDYPEITGG